MMHLIRGVNSCQATDIVPEQSGLGARKVAAFVKVCFT